MCLNLFEHVISKEFYFKKKQNGKIQGFFVNNSNWKEFKKKTWQ